MSTNSVLVNAHNSEAFFPVNLKQFRNRFTHDARRLISIAYCKFVNILMCRKTFTVSDAIANLTP